jgi:hypothetical protein
MHQQNHTLSDKSQMWLTETTKRRYQITINANYAVLKAIRATRIRCPASAPSALSVYTTLGNVGRVCSPKRDSDGLIDIVIDTAYSTDENWKSITEEINAIVNRVETFMYNCYELAGFEKNMIDAFYAALKEIQDEVDEDKLVF